MIEALQEMWADLKAERPTSATYSRDGLPDAELIVVRGGRQTQVEDEDGAYVSVRDSDFIIAAAELIVDGSQTTPKELDKITITDADTTTRTFSVSPVFGERCHDDVDPYGVMIRIHTIEI